MRGRHNGRATLESKPAFAISAKARGGAAEGEQQLPSLEKMTDGVTRTQGTNSAGGKRLILRGREVGREAAHELRGTGLTALEVNLAQA